MHTSLDRLQATATIVMAAEAVAVIGRLLEGARRRNDASTSFGVRILDELARSRIEAARVARSRIALSRLWLANRDASATTGDHDPLARAGHTTETRGVELGTR